MNGKIKCPKCKTKNGYVRQRTKEWICRKCGIATKIDSIIIKNKQPP